MLSLTLLLFSCFSVLFSIVISHGEERAGLYDSRAFTDKVKKPEDHWSCIAYLSAMLKSAVNEEKKCEYSPWAGADNPLVLKF